MTIDAEVQALSRVPLLEGLEPSKLRLLAFISDRMEFQDGEILCHQGDDGDSAFVVLSGEVAVFVDENEVARVGQYAIIGEIAILCDVPRTATLQSIGTTYVLAISKGDFLKLIAEFPKVSLEIMRVLALRLEKTTRELAQARPASN